MASHQRYRVEGMSCDHCQHAIERAVTALDGVESVHVRLETGEVSVAGDVDEDALRAAIVDAGYGASGVR